MEALKVLLLQARDPADPMRAHEHQCFVERTGLPAEHIIGFDLCAKAPSLATIRQYDALMVGGSGDYYVSKGDLPHFDALLGVLAEVAEVGHPTFASCFGYQSMVMALGGEVFHDPDHTEVGSYELTLTAQGRDDPLFGELPESFWTQMGHKDRARRHPDGVPNLACSVACPFQGLRIPGKPVWATQFHPELDRKSNQDRYRHYLEGYAKVMGQEEQAAVLDTFREGPEASALLKRFLRLVFD